MELFLLGLMSLGSAEASRSQRDPNRQFLAGAWSLALAVGASPETRLHAPRTGMCRVQFPCPGCVRVRVRIWKPTGVWRC